MMSLYVKRACLPLDGAAQAFKIDVWPKLQEAAYETTGLTLWQLMPVPVKELSH